MKPNVRLLLLLLAASANIAFADHGMDEARLAVLTAALDDYVADGRLSGGVLHVSRRGEVVLEHAFGHQDIEQNIPMTPDSLHRIASQTKAFTSVGIMMLQEEGKLSISDPVGKYLPEYRQTTVAIPNESAKSGYRVVDADRPITIRDLLTHTSGISYGDGPAMEAWFEAQIVGWYFAGDEESMRDKVARMATLPQAAQPGEQYVYGFSTDILGAVIEEISGQSLSDFLEARLFDPLDMEDTDFFVPADKAARLATVYGLAGDSIARAPNAGQEGGSFYHGQGHYVDGPRVSHSGGAGAVSTARDYAAFLEMLRSGGVVDGVRFLEARSIEQMIVDYLPNDVDVCFGPQNCLPGGFGLGFLVTEERAGNEPSRRVGSYGWGGAYHSLYWVDPAEELTVVYLTQLIPSTGLDDHDRITTLIYQAIVD